MPRSGKRLCLIRDCQHHQRWPSLSLQTELKQRATVISQRFSGLSKLGHSNPLVPYSTNAKHFQMLIHDMVAKDTASLMSQLFKQSWENDPEITGTEKKSISPPLCKPPSMYTHTHTHTHTHVHTCAKPLQSCLTLCDLMNCSTPGFPVHHYLPEFAQIRVHWVSDAIKPSHPLLPP